LCLFDAAGAESQIPLLDNDFLVLINSWWELLSSVLSPTRPRRGMACRNRQLRSRRPRWGGQTPRGDQVTVGRRSVAVFLSTPPL
jgi:hypothetical protein